MYPVTGDPPSDPGAVHVTSADSESLEARTPPGASGTVSGEALCGVEASPSPMALSARTDTRYGVPLSSAGIVKVELVVPVDVQGPPSTEYSDGGYRRAAVVADHGCDVDGVVRRRQGHGRCPRDRRRCHLDGKGRHRVADGVDRADLDGVLGTVGRPG